jgi:hypothetical protein
MAGATHDRMPAVDQWAFLATVRRIAGADVERIVRETERRGRVLGVRFPPQDDGEDEPWTHPPSPTRTLHDLGVRPVIRDERHEGQPLDVARARRDPAGSHQPRFSGSARRHRRPS